MKILPFSPVAVLLILMLLSANPLLGQWPQKARLYVLSIGIRDYKDDALDLKFADKDAQDIAEAFKKMTNMYDVKEVETVLNGAATRGGIKAAFERMNRNTNPEDLFILFFSGHGSKNKLLPYDFDPQDSNVTSLLKDDIIKWLDDLGCNYIVLLDACHSGSGFQNSKTEQLSPDAQEELESLLMAFYSSEKVNLILGSSVINAESFEYELFKNGFFTQCILDAFENRPIDDTNGDKYTPDKDKNGLITYGEFTEYVKNALRIQTSKARENNPKIKVQKIKEPKEEKNKGLPFIQPVSLRNDSKTTQETTQPIQVVPIPIEPPVTTDSALNTQQPNPIVTDKQLDTDRDGVPDAADKCKDEYGIVKAHGCPDLDNDGIMDYEDDCPDIAGHQTGRGCPDADGDGILDDQDSCPQTPGVSSAKGCPDSDGDGIPNLEDKCPMTPGKSSAKGCPDKDGDGIADEIDKCPDIFGHSSAQGCPDVDGDGIVDGEDACPDKKGKISALGCPDGDGDGIPDDEDACDDKPGVKSAKGCPDRDGDGIPDHEDKCPGMPGKASAKGCPDTDGDGIPDDADVCANCFGVLSARGCPDADGDSISDADDACPEIPGKKSAKGCPDADEDGTQDADDQCVNWFGDARYNGCPDTYQDGIGDHIDLCPTEPGSPEWSGCPNRESLSKDPFEEAMVKIPGGEFKPRIFKKVEVGSFYLAKTEVTQAQWRYVMGENPSHFIGCHNCPVENISFEDAERFIQRLNQRTGKSYRLPTEAEWEYAARGGDDAGKKYDYVGNDNLQSVGWYNQNSSKQPHPVGNKNANKLGIYDMSGNVWELCIDYFSDRPFPDPSDTQSSSSRVTRGGSYLSDAEQCKLEARNSQSPQKKFNNVGLRLAKTN